MTQLRRTTVSNENAVYVVLFAIVMVALVSLLALSIGLGLTAINSTKMQQIANVASLAGLRDYVQARSNPALTTGAQYAEVARQSANSILQENHAFGDRNSFGGIKLPTESEGPTTDGGEIVPGSYFVEDPDGSLNPMDPCAGAYPCFIPVDSATLQPTAGLPVNAIRLSLKNRINNPLIAPFAKIFGQEEMRVTSEATSALVQRCTAYVLDVSLSTTGQSHFMPFGNWGTVWSRRWDATAPAEPNPNWVECDDLMPPSATDLPAQILCPNDSALFAMRVTSLQTDNSPSRNPLTQYNDICRGPAASYENGGLIWCNIAFEHGSLIRVNEPLSPLPLTPPVVRNHYPQHYLDRSSPFGKVRVDHFNAPQPLTDFLLAFNAGLRLVQTQSTGADGAVVIPFTGAPRNLFPTTGLWKDLNFLIQLTNTANRGTITSFSPSPPYAAVPPTDEVHPNYIDMGWFPVRTGSIIDDSTHVVAALQQAINTLSDVNVCPATAQKAIILATDGLTTCANPVSGEPDCPPSGRDYSYYLRARDQLIGPSSSSIRQQLATNRIALTTILRSDVVSPNFRVVLGPNGFLSIPEQWALSSRNEAAAQQIFDGGFSGAASQSAAYLQAGAPGVTFKDPNVVFGYLSLDSGGIACPMMNVCTPSDCGCCGGASCYDANNKLLPCAHLSFPGCASQVTFQSCASTNDAPGVQAAQCVQDAVGGNPYLLVN